MTLTPRERRHVAFVLADHWLQKHYDALRPMALAMDLETQESFGLALMETIEAARDGTLDVPGFKPTKRTARP